MNTVRTLKLCESQLYIATPTKCAIEWHLVPSESASWSATVAIAHHSPASASSMQCSTPQQVGSTCFSPSQLARLLRRAEILMLYPGIDIAHIFTLSESAVTGVLSCAPRALSAGVIYVTLQHPDTSSREITIVDMPGEPKLQFGLFCKCILIDSVLPARDGQWCRWLERAGECLRAAAHRRALRPNKWSPDCNNTSYKYAFDFDDSLGV